METLLYTKNDNLIIRTVFISDEEVFATIFEYPDGSQQVVETYKSVMHILESHEYWCKFTGINEETFTAGDGKLTMLIAKTS